MLRIDTPTRAAVLAEARRWLGTPYHHQASLAGVGVDCVGLVRGVWRTLYGTEPEALPGYSRDWSEATGHESLLETARRHLIEIPPEAARPGDVLVFRYRPRSIAKHIGILAEITAGDVRPFGAPPIALSPLHSTGRGRGWREPAVSGSAALPQATAAGRSPADLTLIHAVEGAPVTEVPLIAWWRRRIAAAFTFPGITD